MASGRHSGTELAERILAEMQLAAPGSLSERGAGREQLRQRIIKLLSTAGYPADPPARCAVTLLQAELRGFSDLIERYPAGVVVNMLNRYLALMTEVIGSHGGAIDKLLGDSILVLFGAPSLEIPVQQALACAVEMQQTMARCNQQNEALQLPPLYMGIGIHSGTVVAGAIGARLRQEYTVIGGEVHLVANIAAQSLRGQVLLSENSYRLAREFILTATPSKLQVRGRPAPVTLYELLGTMRPHAMTVPRREVRKSPRVRVQIPCYFQQVEGRAVLNTLHCGQVVDLGYHGLRMISPVPLNVCGEIKITLSLFLLGQRTSEVYARILTAEPDTSGCRCSLEFIDIDLRGQQALKEFVDSRLCQV
jgi:adenylate cyclase